MLKEKTILTKSQEDMEFLCSDFKQNISYRHIATDNVSTTGSFGCLILVFSQQKLLNATLRRIIVIILCHFDKITTFLKSTVILLLSNNNGILQLV